MSNVTLGLSPRSSPARRSSALSLTFTAANWNTAQTVTLTGVDDFVDDGDIGYTIVTAAASSADSNDRDINQPHLPATNADHDPAENKVTPTYGLSTPEAGRPAT